MLKLKNSKFNNESRIYFRIYFNILIILILKKLKN